MRKIEAKELLEKYTQGLCTAAEMDIVETWYQKSVEGSGQDLSEDQIESALNRIGSKLALQPAVGRTVRLWPRIAIAAAVVLVVASTGLFFNGNFTNTDRVKFTTDLQPGKDGATLTLANGKIITISEATAGILAEESGVTITKDASGLIVYTVIENDKLTIGTNLLETSKGEHSQLRLPDGSIVYLNAASKLKYPASFAKQTNRIVELQGEGYFEIAKNTGQSFIVRTAHQEVEVLGTHFNISSYLDEHVTSTTLLEGRIKVTPKGENGVLINPGQQASLIAGKLKVITVETEYAVSWKNGYFMFNHENLEEIMKKLSRWYNIEVVFKDEKLKTRTFFGTISKFENVSKVLGVMQRTNVANFEINGGQVIIRKRQ